MITTYNQAKRLKDLGYDLQWTTFLYEISTKDMHNAYAPLIQCQRSDLFIKAPSISEALQWIREKYEIGCTVELINYEDYQRIVTYLKKYRGVYLTDDDYEFAVTPNDFDTYPEAESALLDELLKFLESNGK